MILISGSTPRFHAVDDGVIRPDELLRVHGCFYRDGVGKRAILSPPATPPTHISSPT